MAMAKKTNPKHLFLIGWQVSVNSLTTGLNQCARYMKLSVTIATVLLLGAALMLMIVPLIETDQTKS